MLTEESGSFSRFPCVKGYGLLVELGFGFRTYRNG